LGAGGLVIIATDRALISRKESIIRMQLLADAGADVVFPAHLPFENTREAVER
jgi:2-methylisocitrate lyase-like PEP mutase family enzyme